MKSAHLLGAVVRTEAISTRWDAAVWARYFTGAGLQRGKKVAQSPCLCGDSGKTHKLSRIYCNVRKCCYVVSATKTNEDRGGLASGGR